ncbi:MAG: single-stranded DNA-binding protein [Desulfobacteraceae bacterium]|nr:MAG: single-stranded DNA-binding protein [Desulfobacteraceae bacterium]
MAGINKAILVGHLGRDPEMRVTSSGMAVATFSIATSEKWKDKNTGSLQDRTEWHRIVAYGQLAQVCADYLKKGKQVYVEGRLQTREWEDRQGNKKTTTEIIAQTIQMLGPSDRGAKSPLAEDRSAAEEQSMPVPEDDIPF